MVTLVIEEETKAYINVFLTAFTHACAWQIVLFTLYLLLLDAEVCAFEPAPLPPSIQASSHPSLLTTVTIVAAHTHHIR